MLRNAVSILAILLIAVAVPQAASQYSKEYSNDDKYKSEQHAFDHPYPVVQESSDYDKDFVKDENSDKGEWHAQMDYDRVRAMIVKAKEALPPLQDDVAKRQKEYDQAVEDAHRVEEEVKGGEPAEEIEEEEKEEEEVKVSDVELPPKPETALSTKELEEALAHLKDCEQQLTDAKDKLLKLLDERDVIREKKQKADAAQAEAQVAYDAAKKATEAAVAQVQVASDNYSKKESEYKKEVQDVEELEAKLETAAVKVRQFRSKVDDKGGIYQSAAHRSAGPMLVALLSLLVASMWAQ